MIRGPKPKSIDEKKQTGTYRPSRDVLHPIEPSDNPPIKPDYLTPAAEAVPFRLIRDVDGWSEEAKDHPIYNLLRYEPNDWQTSYEFRQQIAFHVILTGNAFVFINRSPSGVPLELFAYEPGKVTVVQDSDKNLSYRVQTGKRKTVDYVTIPQEDMWHIKGPSWNGWMGLNATKLARRAIGLMSTGGLTWVGERGKELVRLPGGSQITPNHALDRLGGNSGGQSIIVNVNGASNEAHVRQLVMEGIVAATPQLNHQAYSYTMSRAGRPRM